MNSAGHGGLDWEFIINMHNTISTQMQEQERQAREERKKELEMLAVRREADLHFQQNEESKKQARLDQTKDLQRFHIKQIVS